MSLEYLIAFGGPVLLGVVGALVMARMRRGSAPALHASVGANAGDVDSALASAQAAAHQVEMEIAKARERLAS